MASSVNTPNIFQSTCTHTATVWNSPTTRAPYLVTVQENRYLYARVEGQNLPEILELVLRDSQGSEYDTAVTEDPVQFRTISSMPKSLMVPSAWSGIISYAQEGCPVCGGTGMKVDWDLSSPFSVQASGIEGVAILVEMAINTEKGTHRSDLNFGTTINSLNGIKVSDAALKDVYSSEGELLAMSYSRFEQEVTARLLSGVSSVAEYLATNEESHLIEMDPKPSVTLTYPVSGEVDIELNYRVYVNPSYAGNISNSSSDSYSQWVAQELSLAIGSYKGGDTTGLSYN